MSTSVSRHPLGLPAGSIRAIIALVIAGSFVAHLFSPDPIPLYSYFLLALVPPFFTAHGSSIGVANEPSPLYLPRGLLRLLITAGTLGAIGYFLYLNQFDLQRLAPDPTTMTAFPNYLIAMVLGLFVGMLVGRGPWRSWRSFQDVQAWLSILALFALGVELVIDLVIQPKSTLLVDRATWNTVLIAILSFYFASRL